MQSVFSVFEQRVKEYNDKLLFCFLDKSGNTKSSYTYKQFYDRTTIIASQVAALHQLEKGDRVLLVYSPGIEMICAFFSCVRLGLIPVPVYPPSTHGFESALKKMNFVANDCNAKAIMTESSVFWSIKINSERTKLNDAYNFGKALLKLNWISTDEFQNVHENPFNNEFCETLFLQYTSGSTNDPKGVMVSHENMLYNCAIVVDHLPIGVSWLPQYHDMGLIGYYLFFALKGGTTYGFSPVDFIQRPELWLETITKYKATATSAPNFAYEYCLNEEHISNEMIEKYDLSSLKFVMNAAEPVNASIYEAFYNRFKHCGLQPDAYFTAYGLAEFTLAVTNYGKTFHTFDTAELAQNKAITTTTIDNSRALMSCGKPLGDTIIKIVNPENPTVALAENLIGEIWLTGTSKCQGYWNKPEVNKDAFSSKLLNDNQSYLRTGDLGFMHKDELFVCGRLKDTIIIRGANYYPNDIEKIIEENKLIRKGCVAAFAVTRNGHESVIVIAGVKNNKSLPNPHQLNASVQQQIGVSCAEIIFVPARTVVRTSSGKIMRFSNKENYLNGTLTVVEHIILEQHQSNNVNVELKNPNERINQINALFSGYGLSGSEAETLGDCGLDSMKIAEFAHDLKQLLIQYGFADLSEGIDIRLLQKIAIAELKSVLNDLTTSKIHSQFKFRQAFNRISIEHEKTEREMMHRDANLALPISKSRQPSSTCKNVLLTGGTGFLGPFIIQSLLEQTQADIHVLVRAENETEGIERIKEAFSIIERPDLISSFEKRVHAIKGDLNLNDLGLNENDRLFIEKGIDTIYHNGAYVNYVFDYETLRSANVFGTRALLDLANKGIPKTFNYVSTTFIFGWSVEDTLFETDLNSQMKNLDFGYSQSKWVAEQLVHQAMKNGLPVRIFRPALISPSASGVGYNFDISMRLLVFMLNNGIGTNAKNQVSFTPADIVANNIVAIANNPQSINKTFHVTRDEYASMAEITFLLGEMAGKTFKQFSLKEFVPEVVNRCGKKDLLFPLLNFLVRSEKKISAMEFKRYDNSNYQKYRSLSENGKPDIPLEEVVGGIYKFMLKHNVIEKNAVYEDR